MNKKITRAALALALTLMLAFAGVTCAFAASDSGSLTVTATSNLFSSSTVTVAESQNQVRVTYMLQTTDGVLDAQGELIYDPDVLTPASSELTDGSKMIPNFTTGAQVNTTPLYSIRYGEDDPRRALTFNASSINLYDFTGSDKVFVTMLFDVNADAEKNATDVELYINILGVGDPYKGLEVYPVENDGLNEAYADRIKTAASSVEALPEIQPATTQPVTDPTTTEPSVTDPVGDYKYGDVDLNGTVNINDATLTQKYIAKLAELDETQLKLADVTGEGSVNINDVTAIQKYIAKIITVFDVEK